MTQQALAERLGLKDKSSIAHWESGKSSPQADLIPKLARVLKVSVAQLYGEAA